MLKYQSIKSTLLTKASILFGCLVLTPGISSSQSYSNPLIIPPLLTGVNFSLSFAPSTHQFYPGINTSTYGINGDYLGPTLVFNKGDSINISVLNNLPEITSCHWHGLHVPACADGGPHTTINQGETWHVQYKVMNNAATYWYHPHVHMTTQSQVTAGLAGMIIVKDSVESQLSLPRTYGVDDFPIIIQDRKYSISGQFLAYGLGDSMLVNGTALAYLNCPRQMVRLRLLNGSNARVYKIGFNDQRNFDVIGGDGGLLSQPYSTNRILLANGERAEIVVDFTGDVVGNQIYMMSYGAEMATNIPGAITGGMGGNGPLEAVNFKLFELDVVPQLPNPVTTIPVNLVAQNSWNPGSASRIRNKTISGMGSVNGMGNFLMDNTSFDMAVFNDTVQLNDIEIWNVTNNSNIAHPIHLHDVQFNILSRNGVQPPPQEAGLKDVFLVSPGETVSLITRFEDFSNDTIPYMYHCHNLAHEDMGMMLQFIVVNNTSGISNQIQREQIHIFPNPSTHQWKVQLGNINLDDSGIELLDFQGRKILTTFFFNEEENGFLINNADFSQGVYFLKISDKSKVYISKLIKI